MGIIYSKDLPVPLDVSPSYKPKIDFSFFSEVNHSEKNQSSDSDSKEDLYVQTNNSSDTDSKDDLPQKSNTQSNIKQLLTNNQQLEQEINQFVEEWFSSNEKVDLGNIEILNQKIDLIPDSMEKMIYKKALIISVTFLKKILEESQITFLNQEIKLTMKDK